jgi:hypothetical protein
VFNKIFIFESNAETHPECLQRELFGSNLNWPLQARKGDLCFLYNYHEKLLYGVWEAAGDGGSKIVPDAWSGRYRFQVRITRPTSAIRTVPASAIGNIIRNDEGRVRNILSGDRAHNLIQYFAHGAHEKYVEDAHLDHAEADYRKRFPAEYTSEDGHLVRSKAEMIIDDWLFRHRIPHAYEPIVHCADQRLIPDFLVHRSDGGEVYVEYWGRLDDPVYQARMRRKIDIYQRHSLRLIQLSDDDLKSPDFSLGKKFREYKIEVQS